MNTSSIARTKRLIHLLIFGFVAMGGCIAPSQAMNSDTTLLICNDCQNLYQFELIALQDAQARVQPGFYMVVSSSDARTAYVRVTGTPMTWCDIADCWYYLDNPYADAVTESGASVTSLQELEAIDQKVFNVSRKDRIPPLEMDPEYASSIIGSEDAFVQGALGQAFINHDPVINPNNIQVGQTILCVFSDGTKALFIRVSTTSSVQYVWTQIAWNSEGKLIDRQGNLIVNPNTSGTGTGQGSVSGIGYSFIDNSSGFDYRYGVEVLPNCAFKITIIFRGRETSTIVYTPC